MKGEKQGKEKKMLNLGIVHSSFDLQHLAYLARNNLE
jgi:hypothetical protein